MILALDAKRRLTLPTSLIPAQPGDHFRAECDPEEDAVVFRRIAKNADWLSVLKAYPVKLHDLPPRRREFPKRSLIVIAQLVFRVRTKRGRQRAAMQMWLTQLVEAMHGRILGFNFSVGHVWADLQYQLQKGGKPRPVEDSYIAAIARRHNLTVATGNVKDFQRPRVKVFNPFAETR